jgi:hypothetical protein
MENTKKLSRLSIDLTPSQHKQIKLMAVESGTSIKKLILAKIFGTKKVIEKNYDKALKESISEYERGEFSVLPIEDFRKEIKNWIKE